MTSASTSSETGTWSTPSPTHAASPVALRSPEMSGGLPEKRPPALAEKGWLHGRSPGKEQIIIIHQAALQQITEHSNSDRRVELGGALLGQAYKCQNRIYVEIEAALAAVSGDHGPIHFTFTADSWAQLHHDRATNYPHLDIVGWFHTHPNLGVFYSGDDVVVHSAAFTLPWHVGLVIDPVRREASFFGWSGDELTPVDGFYELLEVQSKPVIDWRVVPASVWSETYEERLAAERSTGGPYAPTPYKRQGATPGRLGLIVGTLGLLLGFFLLAGWVAPLTRQVNQLENLALTLADQALTANVAACPDPRLRILSPTANGVVPAGGELEVIGTVDHPDAFRYRVEVRPAGTELWSLVNARRSGTSLGTLAIWDTAPHQPTAYEMRLTAVDRNNIRLTNSATCLITMTLLP